MKKGFTLIELSIVLVIIGLLIGGILVAQSMIESAKTQKLIREVKQYEVLINLFKERFQKLPGDMNNAEDYWGSVSGSCFNSPGTGTETCNGDGDGGVDYDNGTDNPHEGFRVWEHLSNAGFVDETYRGSTDASCTSTICYYPDDNVPKLSWSDTSLLHLVYVSTANTWAGKTEARHIFIVGSNDNFYNASFTGRWWGQTFTTAQALAIDAKLDDGTPYTGTVTGMKGGLYTPTCTNNDFTNSANYYLTHDEEACMLFIDAEIY